MTHEIKQLFAIAEKWQKAGKKIVLATVVALEGTSYRKPGVRMMLNDHSEVIGAVSGGCIEKEVQRQAKKVFEIGKALLMTYDGRLRLGCEGILYILLEPLELAETLLATFKNTLAQRKEFSSISYFSKTVEPSISMGTEIFLEGNTYSLHPNFKKPDDTPKERFEQTYPPLFQLYIIGAEHDAVHLCSAARSLGWEVTIMADPSESKTLDYFPGAAKLLTPLFDQIDTSTIDKQTALILMTHSYHKDVQYLLALKDVYPAYFGMLGSAQRREKVITKFLEYQPDIDTEFLEQLHGPAGINIGAESPAEIAVSILAEILSVIRHQKPMSLKDKVGKIHD